MFENLLYMNCHSRSRVMRILAVAAKICANVVIYQNVTIGSDLRFNKVAGRWENVGTPIIAENVVVCDGVRILGPIVVGRNSIIAAGATVTKNVAPDSVVFGVNQIRSKDPQYDLLFRTPMIDPGEIVAANQRLVREFERASAKQGSA